MISTGRTCFVYLPLYVPPKWAAERGEWAGQVISAKLEVKLPGNIVLRACLHRNLCCVSSCSKHHSVWWRSVWKRHLAGKLISEFQIPSGFLAHLESPLPPSCNTGLLPLGLRQKQGKWNTPCRNWLLKWRIRGCVERLPTETLHVTSSYARHCWIVPKGMVVTHKVPHVKSNGQHALSWARNISTSVNNFLPLHLKRYFISKTDRCF